MRARGGLLIPLGSYEQHGPHLPPTVDTLVATAVTDGVAAAANLATGRTWWSVAPALGFGESGEHHGFPHTVSIPGDLLVTVLASLADSALETYDQVVFVNAHGGNLTALAKAGQWWRESQKPAYWVPCMPGPAHPGEPPHDAHAGHTETSLMLHLHPHMVAMDKAIPGTPTPVDKLMDDMTAGGVKAVSETGILGDPTTATAHFGERYLREMISGVMRRLTEAEPNRVSCLVDRDGIEAMS
jgi:mycofactocin system creatininase family protein